jgi:hypothetical protein
LFPDVYQAPYDNIDIDIQANEQEIARVSKPDMALGPLTGDYGDNTPALKPRRQFFCSRKA